MLRKSSPPIEPRRFDAPMTATVAGAKNGRSEAATATWSRSSTRARNCSVGAIGKRTSTSPPSSVRDTSKPASRKTASIARVLGEHLGDEALDAGLGGARRELLEQPRRRAASLELVRDRERDLGGRGIAQARVLGERDDPLVALSSARMPIERAAVDPVGIEEVLDERRIDVAHAVEAQVAAVLRRAARRTRRGRPRRLARAPSAAASSRRGGSRPPRRPPRVLDGADKRLLAVAPSACHRSAPPRARPSARVVFAASPNVSYALIVSPSGK